MKQQAAVEFDRRLLETVSSMAKRPMEIKEAVQYFCRLKPSRQFGILMDIQADFVQLNAMSHYYRLRRIYLEQVPQEIEEMALKIVPEFLNKGHSTLQIVQMIGQRLQLTMHTRYDWRVLQRKLATRISMLQLVEKKKNKL